MRPIIHGLVISLWVLFCLARKHKPHFQGPCLTHRYLLQLKVDANQIGGAIPEQLGQLKRRIQTLHLHNNQLNGLLPTFLRQVEFRAVAIDLGSNPFWCPLPAWPSLNGTASCRHCPNDVYIEDPHRTCSDHGVCQDGVACLCDHKCARARLLVTQSLRHPARPLAQELRLVQLLSPRVPLYQQQHTITHRWEGEQCDLLRCDGPLDGCNEHGECINENVPAPCTLADGNVTDAAGGLCESLLDDCIEACVPFSP